MLIDAAAQALLQPVLAMAGLTLLMFIWMYATRIPAMNKAGVKPQEGQMARTLGPKLPPQVQQVADNYNHLFEAPTVFYAMVGYIVLMGHADAVHIACAWIYFACRASHSLVQATINIVVLRFLIFCASWIALAVMIVREVVAAL
jgi:hypothetical protein